MVILNIPLSSKINSVSKLAFVPQNFEQDGDGESGEEETTTAELNTTRDTLASSLHSDDDQQAPAWSSSAPTLPTVRTAKLNNSLSLQSELDRSRVSHTIYTCPTFTIPL